MASLQLLAAPTTGRPLRSLQRAPHPQLPAATPTTPARQQRRRRQQRTDAPSAISAAQKKVFTSFTDMVKGSSEPVLVAFYATWCGPCQMMGNILDEVAPSMRGRVKFMKVDTDKYHSVASQYQVGALPTLVLFKDGQPIDRIEGVVMGPDLKARLEYLLANPPK